MTLFDQLYEDMKTAMRAHDERRLTLIRMLISACKNYRIEKYGTADTALTDEEVIQILTKQIKQRKDSIASYKAAQRDDLVAIEEQEALIIQEYTPALMNADDIRSVVLQKKDSLAISSPAQMGILMGAVMSELKGKADGGEVQKIVREVLNS